MREALVGEAVKLYADAIGKQIEAAALVIEMGGSESEAKAQVEYEQDDLVSAEEVVYRKAMLKFAGESYNALTNRKDFGPDQVKGWLQVVLEWLKKEGGKKVVLINDTTQGLISSVLATATENQWGPRKAAKELLKVWDDTSQIRADRIARTEILGASNLGSQEGAKSTGLDLKKRWVATIDGRVRSEHASMNSEPPIPLDQNYSNGLRFPGDPNGPASEIINCRCTEVYEVIE
jgi:hypothetical protein